MKSGDAIITRVGSGYHFSVPDAGFDVDIRHLRRSSGELHADLIIRARILGATEVTDDHIIHQARYNLSAERTRSTIARVMRDRIPIAKEYTPDWNGFVERMCIDVAKADSDPLVVQHLEDITPSAAQRYLCPPFLPIGDVSTFFGPPNAGKSYTVLSLGLSIATGRVILPGIVPTDSGHVLIVDYETTASTVKRRSQSVLAGANLLGKVPVSYTNATRPLLELADNLADLIAKNDTQLMIVDSTQAALGAASERGGDVADTTIRMFHALRSLGTTVVLIDHVNKTDQASPGAVRGPYGSMFKSAYARDTWEVVNRRADPDTILMGLYNRKSNDRAQGEERAFELHFGESTATWRIGDRNAPELAVKRDLTMAERIRGFMEPDAIYSIKEIAEAIGSNESSTRAQLSRHSDFERAGPGAWRRRLATIVTFPDAQKLPN